MKIYLAGPISGKSYGEVVSIYKDKIKTLESWGYSVLCPMTGKTHLKYVTNLQALGDESPTSTNHAIFERDQWMVRNCDVLLADLSNSGVRVSIGTTMELAWASVLGKHTIVVLPEENIHRHAFILESADIVYTSLAEAYEYLKTLQEGL